MEFQQHRQLPDAAWMKDIEQQVLTRMQQENEERAAQVLRLLRKRKRETDDESPPTDNKMEKIKEKQTIDAPKENEQHRRLPSLEQLRQEGDQSLSQNVAEEEANNEKQRWYSYRVLRQHWRGVKPKLKALGYTFPQNTCSDTLNKAMSFLEYVQAALPDGWACKMLERRDDDEKRYLPVVYQHRDQHGDVRVIVFSNNMLDQKNMKIKRHDFVFYSDWERHIHMNKRLSNLLVTYLLYGWV